jgi:hypothetical protein
MKECNKCKQVLALDMFNKRQAKCKECEKMFYKQRYVNNIEYYKQWRLDNPEYVKQWVLDNKENAKQSCKKIQNKIPPGVYMIKCLANGKCYVGQSKSPYRRNTEHFSKKTDKCTSYNSYIQADLKQYGRNAFVFGIIEYCEPEQLLERETYWINKLNPEYNLK